MFRPNSRLNGPTTCSLSQFDNQDSLETTNLMFGTNMVVGVRSATYIYLVGESHPVIASNSGLEGGTDFNLGTAFWHTQPDGIPLPGKKYVIELDVAVFETDVPPQHMWSPYGKNYKILWERALKQNVD